MTSAAFEIAELDKSLAADGEWITLRRVIGALAASQQFIDVKCRAFVRATRQPANPRAHPPRKTYRRWKPGRIAR
jgi:hypothetical protein